MSACKQCDICGAIIKHKALQASIDIHAPYKEVGDDHDLIDLCPECTNKLQNFIYVLRNYPNNYVIHVHEEVDSNAD